MAIGEIVLGSFLASFFELLIKKLSSLALGYAQQEVISTTMLQGWKRLLVTINAVLDDAEDKQLSSNQSVKLWLDEVKDLAYDMEDLLDEFMIKDASVKLEAESSRSRSLVKWKCSCFGRDKASGSNPNLRSPMSKTMVDEINSRLDTIVSMKASLSLTEKVVDRSNYTNNRLESTSLPQSLFLGREKEEAQILERLINDDENSNATPSIVAIVGMAGIGKTALAQQLYNDLRVSSYFEKRAWVCVSDIFDVLTVTKTILRSVAESPCEDKNLNELQVELKKSLSEKKFLVVLDDIWNEKYGEWTSLLQPFEAGAKGSKIIITTRHHSVVSITRALPNCLEELSIDHCTSLLANHALGATNFEKHLHLETIGKRVAEKCRGLPLAAKMLGGLLRNKENPENWEDVLNNRIWDVATRKNDEVLPALKLSYVHLPSHLKRCFAYCAVFPKDYEFERDELALLWIAEGFLDERTAKAKESILRSARNYFDELVSRSFFQQSTINTSKFLMHDLLNDLAKSIAGKMCFTFGESQVMGDEDDASFEEKARYASFVSPQFVISKSLRASARMKVLRSLMWLTHSKRETSEEELHELLTNLKYLRVLLLHHSFITNVPKCVGDLKHLRYLNLSYTGIKGLPDSIGALCKLQVLILNGCRYLSMLPPNIIKSVSLQFLDIRYTPCLKEMPLNIGNLKNLIILSKFVVGSEKGSRLEELQNLSHLQGELCISELQKVEEVRDARDASLFGKKGLSNLFLHWDGNFGDHRNDEREKQVLHYLRPPTNVENLTISYYGGGIFPSWLSHPSYSKMVYLRLHGCPNVKSLPSLGQLPSLKELSLEDLNAISMIGYEFYGGRCPFPSLAILKFKQMSAWKDWSRYVGGQEKEVPFSCLRHLVVRSCPVLVGTLPSQLDHLIKLEIYSCPHLNNSNSAVCLPYLQELYLEDCNKEILNRFVSLNSLTILNIQNLAELVCFDPGFMSRLDKLEELYVGSCDKLTYLWQDGNEMRILPCLQKLAIVTCPQFTSLVNSLTSFSFANGRLATLKKLDILDCKGLKSLEEIVVESLESMDISHCENLESLPHHLDMFSHLTELIIEGCPALVMEDFPPFPITLSRLTLYGCPKIKSIANGNNLTRLRIFKCPALEDFPPLPITLSSLELVSCPKVKSPPNKWDHLTSLQTLVIIDCHNIQCLLDGGLPPYLRRLDIKGCENLRQPMREWGLPQLSSLEELIIDGRMGGEGEKEWFPSEVDGNAWSLLFPPSLKYLWMINLRNVERLSSGFRSHLPSLIYLAFEDCPKLKYLPEDGLPPSLQELNIYRCKILQDRCAEPTGDYWPLIQEIPRIGFA